MDTDRLSISDKNIYGKMGPMNTNINYYLSKSKNFSTSLKAPKRQYKEKQFLSKLKLENHLKLDIKNCDCHACPEEKI
jgi:uncharacterized protein (UPF0276 family)